MSCLCVKTQGYSIMSESQPSADTSMPGSWPLRDQVRPSADSARWILYFFPRLQNHIRYPESSRSTVGRHIAYSAALAELMTILLPRSHLIPSADSAYFST